MIKFYADSHIPKAVVIQLRRRGIDAIHCQEVGLVNASDEEHLEHATNENRVIMSCDEDFTKLHYRWLALGRSHSGILYCISPVQGDALISIIVKEAVMYYELIAGGAGSIEDDIANHLLFVG